MSLKILGLTGDSYYSIIAILAGVDLTVSRGEVGLWSLWVALIQVDTGVFRLRSGNTPFSLVIGSLQFSEEV